MTWSTRTWRCCGGPYPEGIHTHEPAVPDSGIYEHECGWPGCTRIVQYDDEPYCFQHSPDDGSSVPGYSARRAKGVDR